MTMRSSLAPFAASMREADPEGARKLAARLFAETGIVIIDPTWIDSWGDREFVKAIAAKTLNTGTSKGETKR